MYMMLLAHTRKVCWQHSVVVAPVLAIGNVVDVPRSSQYDPLASFGDLTELIIITSRDALPDVQHCVLWNLSRVKNNMLSSPSVGIFH